MSIRVLEPDVISKIAAGEVVARPSSVVKELVENSLDARATQIAVEIRGGGLELIRVTDDGAGITASEVEVAFERHATSKIISENDLGTISSLGFRGEALPSIAAVAEVSLGTRQRDELAGSGVRLHYGAVVERSTQGCPAGTSIVVQNLFRNVPARLKFVKSPAVETGHIAHVMNQFAMAFPEVKFTLVSNGRVTLQSPGNGDLRDAVAQVYGPATVSELCDIVAGPAANELSPRISGVVSRETVTRSNRNYLSFFVNRRWVQNRMLTAALEGAYKGMLMVGRHPIAVVNIALPPGDLDVNVHPAKSEVRFHRENDVFVAVQKAVRRTLVGPAQVPTTGTVPVSLPSMPLTLSSRFAVPSARPAPVPKAAPQEGIKPLAGLPILRVLGQLQKTYIVAEGPEGMYLIDQHAAHERVLFERLREQKSKQAIDSQGLIAPETLELTAQQEVLLKSRLELLSEFGFRLDEFGERTYLVRSVPSMLKWQDARHALFSILDATRQTADGGWQEGIAVSLACHGATRAGQTLSLQEMEELVHQLEATQMPRTCPHGRPTMFTLGISQVEKEFRRR